MNILSVLLTLSTLLLFATLIPIAVKWFKRKKTQKSRQKAYLMISFVLFFASIWLARFAVRCQMSETHGLSGLEMVFDSFIHSLQTFSMDESYTEHLIEAKRIVQGRQRYTAFIGFLLSLQNAIAPIIGGAILLQLLADVFPWIRFHIPTRKKRYIFSEVNLKTVCLAESIAQSDNGKCCRLIFTDAYIDPADERRAELLLRIKRINAITLKDDISILRVGGKQDITYFLMDENEENNVKCMLSLAEDSEKLYRKAENVRIQIFTGNSEADAIVRQVYKNYPELSRRKVLIKVIRENTNMAYDWLMRTPLFLPFLGQEEQTDEQLSVLIVGDTSFSEEFIRAAFWCGQLTNSKGERIPFQMHILTVDAEKELEQRIAAIMPGISMHENTYCQIYCHDIGKYHNNFDLLFRELPELKQCNYIVVSMGDDLENIKVANQLKRQYHIAHLSAPGKTILSYIVEDPALKRMLSQYSKDEVEWIIPFGSFEDRYSENNISFSEIEQKGLLVDCSYNGIPLNEPEKQDALRYGFEIDGYGRCSSIASAIHAKYKLFSIDRTVFHPKTGKVLPEYNKAKIGRMIFQKKDLLAYLEHIRWCAYMFSIGFRRPTEEELAAYLLEKRDGVVKNEELKLHPCLVAGQYDSERHPAYLSADDWKQGINGPHFNEMDELNQFSIRCDLLLKSLFPIEWKFCQQNKKEIYRLMQYRGSDQQKYYAEELSKLGMDGVSPKLLFTLLEPKDYKKIDYYILEFLPEWL